MNPGSHCEFGNEDVAAFREEDWRFGGYHLDFWIGLHDFLDACEWQLMQFIVVIVRLEVRDNLLPVGCQDVFIGSVKALIDLFVGQCCNS